MEKIPESFQSVQQYFGSFVFSLLEETRSELSSSLDFISSAPYAGVNSLEECGECVYNVKVDQWMYKCSSSEPYKMFPGDILVFTDSEPQTISDLKQEGGTWTLALVTEGTCTEFKVKASCCINEVQSFIHKPQFVVFLRNITTSRNIWNALHMFGNLSIVKEVLYTNNVVRCLEISFCPVDV